MIIIKKKNSQDEIHLTATKYPDFKKLTSIQTVSFTKLNGTGGLSARLAVILLKSIVLRSSLGGVPDEIKQSSSKNKQKN